MLSHGFLEDSPQTKRQAPQKHTRPENRAFVEDILMVEVKGNHGETNATHKAGYRQIHFVFSVHMQPFLSQSLPRWDFLRCPLRI
jgi:hypothetical protein